MPSGEPWPIQQLWATRTFDKEFLGRLPVEVVVGILTRGGSGDVADSMEILKVTGREEDTLCRTIKMKTGSSTMKVILLLLCSCV